ncbi:MAG: RNA polymerase factor sigma-54 [Janthinobacterium lividum]
MQLRQENLQRQIQAQKLAPHLIQANTLLQCSTTELQQLIEQEQQENPALDSLDDGREVAAESGCRLCPGSRIGSCSHCPFSRDSYMSEGSRDDSDSGPSLAESQAIAAARGDETAEDERLAARSENEFGQFSGEEGSGGDADFDPLLLARTQTSLGEQILMHLRAISQTPEESLVAEYLVDSLDDRGYLRLNLDEACAVLHVPCSLITEGIERLQNCDPPGIGARDLRECLLLQMRHLLEENGNDAFDTVAFLILTEYWEELIQHRHSLLVRKLSVSHKRIETAVSYIQKLKPNPAASFRIPWDHTQNGQSRGIRPDVVIKRSGMGFIVEVMGFDNTSLQINPYYRGLYETIRASRPGGEAPRDGSVRLTPDHQKHVIAYVERANMFLKNLQQRRRTIQKITQALIDCQQGFLETGQRTFLRPLTRTRLAKLVEMHESTVSRALLYKYVQLPTQEVVSFDIFFENAVTIKGTIASLVAEESIDSPLSDQSIVEVLNARGMNVARRTVVKYREEMRIPASYLRRQR